MNEVHSEIMGGDKMVIFLTTTTKKITHGEGRLPST